MKVDKNKVKELLLNKVDVKDIAVFFDAKVNTVQQCILRNFPEIYENLRKEKEDKIAELYAEGKTAVQIGSKLDMLTRTVENYFKLERFKDLKDMHEFNLRKVKEENKIRNKEIKKLNTREGNGNLSARSFVLQNIQAYDQKKNGIYIFNQKRSGLATLGVPRTYAFKA